MLRLTSLGFFMNSLNLVRSREILTSLRQEGIRTIENTSGAESSELGSKISFLRDRLAQVWTERPAPGLTRCAALTLMKVSACQELAQRFALAYFLRFKEANVSLVFVASEEDVTENHCFVLVGQAVADKELMMSGGQIAEKKYHVPIREFFAHQRTDAVIVDPFTDFAGVANGPCTDVVSYCDRHKITKVFGISTYAESILGVSQQVKANAQQLADMYMRGLKSHKSDQAQDRQGSQGVLIALLQKFKLGPADLGKKPVREQALRRAAMSGTLEDMGILLSTEIDINAQDDTPAKRYTALHVALTYQMFDNAKYLISQGARTDIANADGVTANDLIRRLGSGGAQDELRSLL
jgi:hypothetical protein